MASIQRALRATPRTSTLRPLSNPLRTPAVQRTYAVRPNPATDKKPVSEAEQGSEDIVNEEGDPNMNGAYPDPSLTSALPVKRSLRDPYGNPDGPWWDPIERRNYGETIHEDNDILGVFTTEEYRHFTPGWGGVLMGTFIATVGALCAVVYRFYPDRPSAPRTFPRGLEAELGGPGAVRARMSEDEESVL